MIWGRFKAKPLPCEQESLRARVSASPLAEASSPGAWRSGSGRLVSCQDLSSRNLLPDTFLPTGNGRQRLPSGPRCRTGSACCVASGNALCLSEPPQQAIPQGLVGTWRSECFFRENSLAHRVCSLHLRADRGERRAPVWEVGLGLSSKVPVPWGQEGNSSSQELGNVSQATLPA